MRNGAMLTAKLAAVCLVFVAPGCVLSKSVNPKATVFRPGIVALPHADYEPGVVDRIARSATYSAWIALNTESSERTLDLAVWPSRLAATKAVAEYRKGGPRTYPDASLGTGFPHRVRRLERVRNVTLAWYSLPSPADERAIKGALRFNGGAKTKGDYTALWALPGTAISADATAATGPARYSARLEAAGTCEQSPTAYASTSGCPGSVVGPLTFAIWPSVKAAKSYIRYYRDVSPPVTRVRNVTIEVADFGTGKVSQLDKTAVVSALH
jgi:hypothetical protein